jgi:hypothetical protein
MRSTFHQTLKAMEQAFRRLELRVPPPQEVPFRDHFVLRHVEKTILQALVQKLARFISGLHAVDALLIRGLVQEEGVIKRTLDEIGEDIIFLTAAVTNDEITDLHRQYLDAFFEEEFDNVEDIVASTQKRNYPPRRKIRAYNQRILGEGINTSKALDQQTTLSKAYSGYVHAASPQIMDMCGGNPPRFYISGMNGTPRVAEHVDDAKNYFYRGLLALGCAAKAFGDDQLVEQIYKWMDQFQSATGLELKKDAIAET